ncbi:pentapeptide repeat-containing protein [Actinokineospora diospyrosa]|uniref:Uncharacterized protein YjbI, contains pentapeptide repeats n=1 Tax=Actinokineospora diospyrosa TaxID=103728 RepID=A0ABT1I545_9PSEU|nr:pentapeptide repeat-containing protein [Actinokineospora diospyrosa]MCP2267747.1 Uncharacterized protein YjbI, contains pentapeptide repeats [Actinokineospora diospyrosa]
MEFLKVAGKTLHRASIEEQDLVDEPLDFAGAFAYRDARLGPGEQSGVTGGGSLSVVVITDVDLSGSRLSPVELANVRFDGADLANATVSAPVARRTEFLRSQAIGLRLDIDQAADVYARDCRFDYATLRFGDVKNTVVFQRCSFRESLLAGDLSNVVFDECDLIDTDFEATRATGCDLTESRVTGVRGLLSMRGARIYADQANALASQLAAEAGLNVIP